MPMKMDLSRLAGRVADLCRGRGGPQDLPWSPSLLVQLVVAATVLDVIVGSLLGDNGSALAHSLLGTAVVLALCRLALAIRHLDNRFVQTATALVACSILITLVQMPLAFLIEPVAADAAPGPFQALLRWGVLATLVWQVVVYAHIMRQAMDGTLGIALMLTTSWVIASWAIDNALLGSAG